MKNNKLRVGIIGANPNGSWGSTAHLPALQNLPSFEVTAVGATRLETATEAAKYFGIPHAFADPYELATHPEVDLVVVAVKVPHHEKLIQASIQAGKHVFSEFPLGKTTEETRYILQSAESKRIRHFVSLQSRANAELTYVKDLIESGYVGKVHAVHVNYSLPNYPTRSATIDQGHVYMLDEKNGANNLTITAGHLLDGIMYLFGSFQNVSATLKIDAKEVPVIETGETITNTSPDHILVNGTLENGALFSSHIRNTYTSSFLLEINGSKGDLVLTFPSESKFAMFQIDPFIIKGAQGKGSTLARISVPDNYYLAPREINSVPAYNIAQLYTKIYQDIQENTYTAPNFHTALTIHKLFDKIRLATESVTKQSL
jgi:predicted dehydrogenase